MKDLEIQTSYDEKFICAECGQEMTRKKGSGATVCYSCAVILTADMEKDDHDYDMDTDCTEDAWEDEKHQEEAENERFETYREGILNY